MEQCHLRAVAPDGRSSRLPASKSCELLRQASFKRALIRSVTPNTTFSLPAHHGGSILVLRIGHPVAYCEAETRAGKSRLGKHFGMQSMLSISSKT